MKVNYEYMCSMSWRDGSRQVLEGWTVEKITASIPFVNLTTAELKATKKRKRRTVRAQVSSLKLVVIVTP